MKSLNLPLLHQLFQYIVWSYEKVIEEASRDGLTLDYVMCMPDEVRYPIQLQRGDVAWCYRLYFRFESGYACYRYLIFNSPECPTGEYTNYADLMYEETKATKSKYLIFKEGIRADGIIG